MALKESEKEEILDAVAEEIADIISNMSSSKNMKDSGTTNSIVYGRYSDSMIDMKQRISALETKIDKKLVDFEIILNSVEKQLNEKFHSISNEEEKEYFKLVDQIAALRVGVIRLSNEIKEIKIQLALRKS
jgi:hypothetical protein